MNITANTKIIGRFHKEENGTGLDIYNPYFQECAVDALYLLFVNYSILSLIEGFKRLNLAGAITAGFERDLNLPKIVDDLSEASVLTNRVSMVANKNGKVYGHYHPGEGLFNAINQKTTLEKKKVIIVGAGTVVETFLLAMQQNKVKPSQLHIANRTLQKAQHVSEKFNIVDSYIPLEELKNLDGDILINASRVGSIALDTIFSQDFVSKFSTVVDVTFGVENTNLITLAKGHGSLVISGWDMFTHHAAVALNNILGHNANIPILREKVAQGLTKTNHGARLR